MNDRSNSRKRVAVHPDVFGHRVIGSPTGREMSTPDTSKPDLVEVAVQRADNAEGVFWVPKDTLSDLTYEVSIQFHQDDFESPTDAVLGMIAHLRHAEPGELTFNVRCVEDNVTYSVEATQDDDREWAAWVYDAAEPNVQQTGVPGMKQRVDLIPSDTNLAPRQD